MNDVHIMFKLCILLRFILHVMSYYLWPLRAGWMLHCDGPEKDVPDSPSKLCWRSRGSANDFIYVLQSLHPSGAVLRSYGSVSQIQSASHRACFPSLVDVSSLPCSHHPVFSSFQACATNPNR